MADDVVVEIPVKQSRITVVDESNFNQYVDEKTGVDPEAEGKAELARVEEEKAEKKAAAEAEADPTHDVPEVPKDKKGKINERFKTMADQRKAAEELATKREAEAKTEREERIRVQEERDALKAKYEPPKPDVITEEPQPTQFRDAVEYGKALKDWTADNTRRELAAEQRNEAQAKEAAAVNKAWAERLAATKAELPDHDEVIEKSEVKVSNEVMDAIVRSKVGPRIRYHLANNPDVAEEIGRMTVGDALYAIGELAAQFKTAGPAQSESKTSIAEISKAPPPITPLKNGTAAIGILRGSDEWTGTYDEWKKRYLAGKIH